MWDHRVSGRPLFPGAAFFEAAAGAALALLSSSTFGPANLALSALSITAPLVLPSAFQAGMESVQVETALAAGQMEVRSGQPGKFARHLSGAASRVAAQATAEPVLQQTSRAAHMLLLLLSATSVRGARPAACASLAPPTHEASGLRVSPAVLDSCLQLGAVGPAEAGSTQQQLRVPTGVGALMVPAAASADEGCAALSRPAAQQQQQPQQTVPGSATYTDYALLSGAGLAVCSIGSLEAKPMAAPKPAAPAAPAASGALAAEQWLYEVSWQARGLDAGGAVAAAAASAAQQGTPLDLGREAALAAASAIAFGQAAVAQGQQAVTLVTRGLQQGARQQPGPAPRQSSQAGSACAVMRTMAQELTGMTVAAVDVQAAGPATRTAAASLLAAPAGAKAAGFPDASPYGFAVAGGLLSAASLLPSRVAPALPAFQLMPEPRGALQNLVPRAVPASEVASGKVLVSVRAVGINFRWAKLSRGAELAVWKNDVWPWR